MRLRQRLIELPPGLDIVAFLQHDGKPPADMQAVPAESRQLTLADFRDRYLTTHRDSLEERTVEGSSCISSTCSPPSASGSPYAS